MRFRKRQRLWLMATALLLLGGAVALVLTALQSRIAFFVTPSDLGTAQVEPGRRFRLGGLVVAGSVRKEADGGVRFAVSDSARQMQVAYKGVLPDLFRDGQGVVCNGYLGATGVFMADEVLAKHDERYMPKEVADALKAKGLWQEGQPR